MLASAVMVPGRERISQYLNVIPGLADVLKADPTLTDMQWVGDRVGLHFCDGEMILQIDPTELSATKVPMVGKVPIQLQVMISAMVAAANMPVYVTLDVENREQGQNDFILYRGGEASVPESDDRDAYVREIDHFLHCLRSGAAPAIGTLEDATLALRTAWAAIRSADAGEPVRI